MDFNDYYYFLLCKKYEYIMLTDDGDYSLGDVKVVTLNENSLNLATN